MVSIKEVAEKAGVAISTVSKVLNGYPNVSKETRERVQLAISELNYIPNSIASALSSKKSGRVALLLDPKRHTQAIDQIFMQYLLGAVDKAKELELDVVTIFYNMVAGMTKEELEIYLRSQSIEGIVIFSLSREEPEIHRLISESSFDVVLIDVPMSGERISCVGVDHKQAQYEVAKKTILEDNCKSVLYIAGKEESYVSQDRLEGMKQLAEELQLDLRVEQGEFSELTARNLAFSYAKDYDCIVCASDLMAIGAMNALIEMDIFRPVCGFDGITLMGYVGKQMNTVSQNFYTIASVAMEEIKRLLDGEKGRPLVLPHQVVKLYYHDIIC